MKILHVVMRYYSYLYTLFISVFLTGLGVVAYLSGLHNWKVDTFIWTGEDLSKAMVAVGIVGVASVVLAVLNVFRLLLPLVALALFGLTVYGYFWQGYKFPDAEAFQGTVAFAVGAFGSFACSLMEFKRR
ncbi:MAG: hypothetical protein ACK52Z_00995 [Acidobacteriota bacterium]